MCEKVKLGRVWRGGGEVLCSWPFSGPSASNSYLLIKVSNQLNTKV